MSFIALKVEAKKSISNLFPLFMGSFLESSATAFPVVFVGFVFGEFYTGILSMALIIMLAPITFIGSGMGSFFLTEFGTGVSLFSLEPSEQRRILKRSLLALLMLSICYLILIFTLADNLIETFLGDKWIEVVSILKLLAIPNAINFIWYPLVNLFWVKKEWSKFRSYSISRLVAAIFAGTVIVFFGLEWKIAILFLFYSLATAQLFGFYLINRSWHIFRA